MRTKLALEVAASLLLGRDIEAIVVVNRQVRLGCSRRNIKSLLTYLLRLTGLPPQGRTYSTSAGRPCLRAARSQTGQ